MYLFNKDEKLIHYENVYEIIEEFMNTRLEYYNIRKEYQLSKLNSELKLYSNKYKFILELLEDKIDLRRKKSIEINELLTEHNYDKYENSYSYLVKMPMESVNEENVNKLKNKYENIKSEIDILSNKTIQEIYLGELTELKESL